MSLQLSLSEFNLKCGVLFAVDAQAHTLHARLWTCMNVNPAAIPIPSPLLHVQTQISENSPDMIPNILWRPRLKEAQVTGLSFMKVIGHFASVPSVTIMIMINHCFGFPSPR